MPLIASPDFTSLFAETSLVATAQSSRHSIIPIVGGFRPILTPFFPAGYHSFCGFIILVRAIIWPITVLFLSHFQAQPPYAVRVSQLRKVALPSVSPFHDHRARRITLQHTTTYFMQSVLLSSATAFEANAASTVAVRTSTHTKCLSSLRSYFMKLCGEIESYPSCASGENCGASMSLTLSRRHDGQSQALS